MRLTVLLTLLSVAFFQVEVARADYCSIDGCSINCPHGCAATIVKGKCVTGCASEEGDLGPEFWQGLDNAVRRSGLSKRDISEMLCLKGVRDTRGYSGGNCQSR